MTQAPPPPYMVRNAATLPGKNLCGDFSPNVYEGPDKNFVADPPPSAPKARLVGAASAAKR